MLRGQPLIIGYFPIECFIRELRLVNSAALIPLSTGKGIVDECEYVLQGRIQWRSLKPPAMVRYPR